MNQEQKKPINWLAYGTAWLKYAGSLFTALGGVGDIVRDHLSSIKPPKVDEFYK